MNNLNANTSSQEKQTLRTIDIVNRDLARRYRAERRFRLSGLSAIIASLLFLALLFLSIVGKGYSAFEQTFIRLDILTGKFGSRLPVAQPGARAPGYDWKNPVRMAAGR
ncbi:MAG: DUF3333 domain-containing protein [Desulfobacterales bacterium]